MFKYEEQFRKENPQTIGEIDAIFDLENYKDWLEEKLDDFINYMQEISTGEIVGQSKNYKDTLFIVKDIAKKSLEDFFSH